MEGCRYWHQRRSSSRGFFRGCSGMGDEDRSHRVLGDDFQRSASRRSPHQSKPDLPGVRLASAVNVVPVFGRVIGCSKHHIQTNPQTRWIGGLDASLRAKKVRATPRSCQPLGSELRPLTRPSFVASSTTCRTHFSSFVAGDVILQLCDLRPSAFLCGRVGAIRMSQAF